MLDVDNFFLTKSQLKARVGKVKVKRLLSLKIRGLDNFFCLYSPLMNNFVELDTIFY